MVTQRKRTVTRRIEVVVVVAAAGVSDISGLDQHVIMMCPAFPLLLFMNNSWIFFIYFLAGSDEGRLPCRNMLVPSGRERPPEALWPFSIICRH